MKVQQSKFDSILLGIAAICNNDTYFANSFILKRQLIDYDDPLDDDEKNLLKYLAKHFIDQNDQSLAELKKEYSLFCQKNFGTDLSVSVEQTPIEDFVF